MKWQLIACWATLADCSHWVHPCSYATTFYHILIFNGHTISRHPLLITSSSVYVLMSQLLICWFSFLSTHNNTVVLMSLSAFLSHDEYLFCLHLIIANEYVFLVHSCWSHFMNIHFSCFAVITSKCVVMVHSCWLHFMNIYGFSSLPITASEDIVLFRVYCWWIFISSLCLIFVVLTEYSCFGGHF